MDILNIDQHANQLLIKKYRRQINTARIIIFILIAFALLGSSQSEYQQNTGLIRIVIFMVFLAVNILGYKWPFASLLTFTILFVFAFAAMITSRLYMIMYDNGMASIAFGILTIAIQGAYLYYMVRCTAGRCEKIPATAERHEAKRSCGFINCPEVVSRY